MNAKADPMTYSVTLHRPRLFKAAMSINPLAPPAPQSQLAFLLLSHVETAVFKWQWLIG